MNNMHNIKVEKLCKTIKNVDVLTNISIELNSGNIYGFIGINGSGKTMLIKALSGLIHPTSGHIYIDGKEVYKDIYRIINVGIIIENASLYPEFTGYKNLEMISKIKKIIQPKDIIKAIERVGLDPYDKRPVNKYSLGMKQRLIIAQAIMEHPDFLLLDEPTNALDIDGINLIRNIIKEEAERGSLVIIASHNMNDIGILCNKTYEMNNGYIKEIEE